MKIIFKNIYAFIIVFLSVIYGINPSIAQSVNIGNPPIWNFPKKTYSAGTQNWCAAQDNNGIIYWANNEGLLSFDGNTWSVNPVSNSTIVRSVAIDNKQRIFVGAQSEFGYFIKSKNGKLTYHSLIKLIATKIAFDDVWEIIINNDAVFFRTSKAIFQYKNDKIIVHQNLGIIQSLFATQNGLFLQSNFSSIYKFNQTEFKPFISAPFINSDITAVLPWKSDTILITTLKNGIFSLNNQNITKWSNQSLSILNEKRIYSASILPNNQIAVGTSLDGVYILNEQKDIYRHLTKKNGLQNNNILHTFTDRSGNLWLGLDNGIDYAVLDEPFKSINPDGDLQGAGYTAAVFQGNLYLGVSNGLYVAPWHHFYPNDSNQIFKKINNTDGQVWGLKVIDNELLLGHHEGSFSISNQNASKISNELGSWTFVKLSENFTLGGNYEGLTLFEKKNGRLVFVKKFDALKESCRIMVNDNAGSIWISHPYRGLYRAEWKPENPLEMKISYFNSKNGLPTNLNNCVFQIADKPIFTTENGVYQFDKSKNKFIIDKDFNQFFGEKCWVKFLSEDKKKNIWFVTNQEVGVLLVDDLGVKKKITKKVFPELKGKLLSGFEFMYPIDEENILFGTEQGFLHYDAKISDKNDKFFDVILSKISVSGSKDSTLFERWVLGDERKENVYLESKLNNIRFSFSATDFKHPSFITYQTRLTGLEKNWSTWSNESFKNYTNLPSGEYLFEVKAMRLDGKISKILSYPFVISPPWYKSNWAFAFYFLCLLGLIYYYQKKQKLIFENEKNKLTIQHEMESAKHLIEVENSKAALISLENKQLESEIKFKNQELASATMHLVQKGEILQTIKEALDQILLHSTNAAVKKEIQHLLNLLNFDKKIDDDWEHFAFHFDQVHVDFLKRLRDSHPSLSINDSKLCAYLRMNLNSKEIASMMNISVRGVETSRYRLRKKLNLPNDANLNEFMLNV